VIAAVLPPLAALGIAVFLGVVLNLVERRVWPRRVATADEVPAALAD
jgi:hypothetical protein